MKLRIDALSDIDPLRVPLPHGTEVTTRVDRVVSGTTIEQGAVGRVVAVDDRAVTVQVVGVGRVRYARAEVVPRKSGQLQFAQRRELAWRALRHNTIIETVVGSRAWGLADASSDTDMRGVFALPFPWTTGLVEPPSDLVSIDGSTTVWEIGKAFRQGIRADPNTLEMLMLPGARALDDMGQWILDEREAFVSAEIYGTFGRYALSQLKRLGQSMRLAEHRRLLLEWLAETPDLSLDGAARRLATAALTAEDQPGRDDGDRSHRAKQYIKQLYGSMFDQGLLRERNYASLVEFAASRQHSFELPRELRPKNAYNLLRLLATARYWLRTGRPEFVVVEPLRSELLAIKRQQVELPAIIARAEELAAELEQARADTPLPAQADVARIDALLRRLRQEAARRWHRDQPGPFGRDAAEMPLAHWD